jgi:hypothetical protein
VSRAVRIVVLLGLGLLFCAGPSVARPGLCPVKTTGFAIGLISDWHNGGASSLGFDIPAWMAAQTPKPAVVLHAGDVVLGIGTQWTDLKAAFAAEGMTVYTCLGNHDFDDDSQPGYSEIYPSGESPIDDVVAPRIPQMTHVPYYRIDFGSVRALFLDDNYDTTVVVIDTTATPPDTAYVQAYAECNPPGRARGYWMEHGFDPKGNPNGTNPEYAGWVTSDSTSGQLAWIKQQTAGFGGTFLLVVAHRSPYTPMATGSTIRPPDLSGRSVGWAIASRAGVDFALTGDTHTCGLSKRMYRGAQSDAGTYFLTARCYEPRTAAFGSGPGSPSLTEADMYWPKTADLTNANEDPSTVFGYMVFHGNRATVKIVQGHANGSFSERYTLNIDRRTR